MTATDGFGSPLDPRIARIEQGIPPRWPYSISIPDAAEAALADLRAWQEIAGRHGRRGNEGFFCHYCYGVRFPCPDRLAADAALDRLNTLWGTDD